MGPCSQPSHCPVRVQGGIPGLETSMRSPIAHSTTRPISRINQAEDNCEENTTCSLPRHHVHVLHGVLRVPLIRLGILRGLWRSHQILHMLEGRWKPSRML